MTIDVEPKNTVEDVITLITVKNNYIDFDRATLYFNKEILPRNKKLSDCNIQDDYTLVLVER